MLIPSLLLAMQLTSNLGVPVQSALQPTCFVFGEVFWSATQVAATLSSNCPIKIERNERLIKMTSHAKVIHFLIPTEPGIHEFVYRWGSLAARLDDEKIDVVFGVGGDELLKKRSPRPVSD
jgi:hypothetical protein